ncbi:MAG: AAA family ATPase [Flavobacteriaceae bacterium]
MRILVFGLPGSGKTTFARQLSAGYAYFNADEVRKMFNDWDFSMEGRTRQAQRMGCMSALAEGHSIIDFICPFDVDRQEYDVRVWMNTIKKGRFNDTNKMFEAPSHCHFEVTNFDYQNIIKEIRDKL